MFTIVILISYTRIPRMTMRHCWISAPMSRTKLKTSCRQNPALGQGHLVEVRRQRVGQARSVKLRRSRDATRTSARHGPFPGIVTWFLNHFATIVQCCSCGISVHICVNMDAYSYSHHTTSMSLLSCEVRCKMHAARKCMM